MGKINVNANLYRQGKNGEYKLSERAGHIGPMMTMKEQIKRHVFQYPLGEYHPRRTTNYKANNQRPAERRRNIRLHSKH